MQCSEANKMQIHGQQNEKNKPVAQQLLFIYGLAYSCRYGGHTYQGMYAQRGCYLAHPTSYLIVLLLTSIIQWIIDLPVLCKKTFAKAASSAIFKFAYRCQHSQCMTLVRTGQHDNFY